MKPGRLFWGISFIVFGVLVLLERVGVQFDVWESAWRLWPLALVLLGVALLVHSRPAKWIAASLAAIVLGVAVYAGVASIWSHDRVHWSEQAVAQEFHEAWEPVEHAKFSLDAGAGRFILEDTTAQLFSAATRSNVGTYHVSRSANDGSEEVTLSMEGRHRGWHIAGFDNEAIVRLNALPSWDMDVEVGAAKVDFDLSSFNVRHLRLSCGAATVRLKIGSRAEEADLRVNAGASSIHIEIPQTAGCEIRVDAPLSSKHFDGFSKVRSGLYRTPNYESAARKIMLSVDSGVSSVRVDRYASSNEEL